MLEDHRSRKILYPNRDSRILCDMLSMCFDGFFANSALCGRVGNTLDKHVFKKVSSLYRRLAERLLHSVGVLPEDTGTMNPEPGYIATAYLSALNAADRYAPSRVMSVNWQVIKRIGKLVRKLDDKLFANMIVDYLACIQIVLDNAQQRRKVAKLVK
ncbi:hypothetical protein [Marinomonas sp.]|uniref:hypothetical protein n=1 Tax=Marinomonas sp. TaxID=1904862 RepID=UPI003BAAB256